MKVYFLVHLYIITQAINPKKINSKSNNNKSSQYVMSYHYISISVTNIIDYYI